MEVLIFKLVSITTGTAQVLTSSGM